ncbi:MAG TPA: PilZ domain-containing protein [Treponemataceae bacterium]|nr:PilZ domain-containing protein [Treponemataceae bacterium]
MGIITSQQLTTYYDKYRDMEIMFSKEITTILHLVPRQIYFKCGGEQWPCIINSTSFLQSRIIIGTRGGAFRKITEKENAKVSLHFSFTPPKSDLVTFFVNTRVSEVSKFSGNQELAIVTLEFTQRPPDLLIELVGRIHAANKNAFRRREERITISKEVTRKLQLDDKKTTFSIDNVPRKCILRDISFSGAKVIIVGVPKFVKNKEAVVGFSFEEPDEFIEIAGKVVQVVSIEGRKELLAVSLHFDEPKVSLAYKIRISNYLSTIRIKKPANSADENSTISDEKIASEKANKE